MAGLGSLDSLYSTFLGQTNEAMNQPEAPWQQELMESVNPQKVRRDNIKRALAQASMALATTPGNFLTGLSAAAGVGANSYLQQKQDSEDQRIKAAQLVQLAQQKQQDRRLSLLLGAIGVNRDIASDKRDEDYNNARVAYWKGGGSRGTGSTSQTALERADHDLRVWIGQATNANGGTPPTQEQIDAQWQSILRNRKLTDPNNGVGGNGEGEDYTAEADYYTDNPDADGGGENVSQFDFMTGNGRPKVVDMANGAKASPQETTRTPPPQAVEALKSDPRLKAQFDAKYGQGAADRYLGN